MSRTDATKGSDLIMQAIDDGQEEYAQLDILQRAFTNLQRKKEELIANKKASLSGVPIESLNQRRADLEVATEEKHRMLVEIREKISVAEPPTLADAPLTMIEKHGVKKLFDKFGGRRRRITLRKKGKGKGKGKKSMRRKGRKTVKRRKTNRRRRTMQK